MLYRFAAFELDVSRCELRVEGAVRPLEPQVFALLVLLVENRERLVTRDEIIEKVWDGRVVSDAAVASRIRSIRQALGDDGKSQRYVRTLHRLGFRFVHEVNIARSAPTVSEVRATGAASSGDLPGRVDDPGTRPSIAVLPLQVIGDAGPHATIAQALPHELIMDLARLRWLLVTARGSSFRLRASDAGIDEIGRLLGVRYCLSGTMELAAGRLAVTTDLVDTRDARVIWADRFVGPLDDVHAFREEIRSRILSALEIRIPLHEAELARRKMTEDLDAWSAFHLGLQHMYHFNRQDNAAATALFEQAIARDPGFARAHAGLSFVHFQTAFMRHSEDLAGETARARRYAERGLELDPMDPFVNFTMGRAHWLVGDLESALAWLERATAISPNYAQGIYARAWTETLSGRSGEGRAHVDFAMRLSPLDPLYYGMLGTRAFAHMIQGEDAQAAHWAERAARSPGAHVLIAMIATAAHALAGDSDHAASWAANVRSRNAVLTRDDFFRSFPIKPDEARHRIAAALTRWGF